MLVRSFEVGFEVNRGRNLRLPREKIQRATALVNAQRPQINGD